MNDMTKPVSDEDLEDIHYSYEELIRISTALYAAMITHHGVFAAEHESMDRLAVEHAKRLLAQVDQVMLP